MSIDPAFVARWAAKYPKHRDSHLLAAVHPRLQARGSYDRADLLAVGRWKARRIIGRLDRNSDQHIEDVTRTAFNAPDTIKAGVLTLLDGVQIPMASALLTIWDPDRFTVIDTRALATLRAAGELDPHEQPTYTHYLALCRSIAERCGCDLRTLDRALWAANGTAETPT